MKEGTGTKPMRVNRIEISNFRSIRHLVVDLSETTVFVGPNNAGKTAILDALRIPLTRRWGQGGTGFNEYDVTSRVTPMTQGRPPE